LKVNLPVSGCILWSNVPDQIGGEPANASASIIQGGYAGTNIFDVDPLLKPLGDYGGTTPTMSPVWGSPAINAGTTGADFPTNDQRDFPRDAHPDIGACEFQTALVSSDQEGPLPIGGRAKFSVFTDLDAAGFEWFSGVGGDESQPLAWETNSEFTTVPMSLGADFWVRVTGVGTNFDSATQSTSVRGTYPEWLAFHGLFGPDAGTDASPARDGIPNLVKFASGLDPNRACSPGDYASLVRDAGSNTVSLTWLQSKTPTDVSSAFRQSHDLRSWSPARATPVLIDFTTAYELWQITVPTDTNRLFLDIEVSHASR
jgi:hypothetical protein